MALKIEDDIAKTKELLQKLRFAIISNYYTSCSSGTVETEFNSDLSSTRTQDIEQKAIHPSLKKLIGKRPLNEIVIGSRSTRKSVQKAHVEIKKENKEVTTRKTASCEEDMKMMEKPVEVPGDPPVVQLTSSRGRDQLMHLLVAGNTSQFLNEETNCKITHKWMCYLKTKTKVPIEKLVTKVRFHLDPSYKPNDVIDVCSSPFSITKRGYGDFQIQLLIFFKDEIQMKPLKIFHHLKLDKKMTGHQTLGGETVSELWTRNIFNDDVSPGSAENVKAIHLMDHDYLKSLDSFETLEDKQTFLDNERNEVQTLNVDSNGDSKDQETRDVAEWIERNFSNNHTVTQSQNSFFVDVD